MLDRDGPVPVYKQIADLIQEQIRRGELVEGDAIPSEAEMEAEYRVARPTARRVTRELRDLGLVHTLQGVGTFVGDGTVYRPRRNPPLYELIATEIAERIRRRELKPNRPIPSEKSLMQQYGVAKVTVRQAIGLLRDQGYVFTVPHRGSYVRAPENWPDRPGDAVRELERPRHRLTNR
ncbi:GntR family transcriptional regulator [Microbispora catharanthi]|uniref:GntR family transcriptional regulator n=1 Tax=Microbispora catharanthi TaxID=1712871 RepID=A0A5N6BSJ5_9ACTN|nr:GntR family transcriptional regulator [Microbispora catharanthi]KAB8183437.1 GntR family transcriptional regulator [Microbispora catharanthi]